MPTKTVACSSSVLVSTSLFLVMSCIVSMLLTKRAEESNALTRSRDKKDITILPYIVRLTDSDGDSFLDSKSQVFVRYNLRP